MADTILFLAFFAGLCSIVCAYFSGMTADKTKSKWFTAAISFVNITILLVFIYILVLT